MPFHYYQPLWMDYLTFRRKNLEGKISRTAEEPTYESHGTLDMVFF